MEVPGSDDMLSKAVSISAYLDGATIAFATYRPPATVELDTTELSDGHHTLEIRALDSRGRVGRRTIPFIIQNGPGITVTGIRANERVSGSIALQINAFSASEPFDPVSAESSGPIPVWTWVMTVLIVAWAAWYGLTNFQQPPAFAQHQETAEGIATAIAPMNRNADVQSYSGKGATAGFDYAATGDALYAANCAACHGATGAGVPGAFPALVGDAVITANDPTGHINVVLHGLHGRAISGITYSSPMPSFIQLSDKDIAAIIDHERTSWGNRSPTISPGDVKALR